MKTFLLTVSIVCFVLVVPACFASTGSAFDQIKALAGDWEGKNTQGQPVSISYKVVSAGSTVMETINAPNDTNMVTMYYLDGSSLVMTHFCMAQNQPRMKASNSMSADNTVNFKFLDATNLTSPSAGHMGHLVLTLPDAQHLTQEWTWVENGKEKVEKFTLARKQ